MRDGPVVVHIDKIVNCVREVSLSCRGTVVKNRGTYVFGAMQLPQLCC